MPMRKNGRHVYFTDPEWCNVHWKNIGRDECDECLQSRIGYAIDTIIIKMILRGWNV